MATLSNKSIKIQISAAVAVAIALITTSVNITRMFTVLENRSVLAIDKLAEVSSDVKVNEAAIRTLKDKCIKIESDISNYKDNKY